MNLLDAVNICLRNAGHGAVNALSDANDKSAHAQSTIERVKRRILSNGYEINTNKIDLEVDASGRVPISSQYLKVRLEREHSIRYDGDTAYIWNLDDDDYEDERVTDVEVVFNLEFTELNEVIANWVAWEACVEYWHEARQEPPSEFIVARMIDARSHALNTALQRQSLHDATGWSNVVDVTSQALVNLSGHWVAI